MHLPPQLLSLAVFLYLTHPRFLHFYVRFLLRLDCSAAAAVNQTFQTIQLTVNQLLNLKGINTDLRCLSADLWAVGWTKELWLCKLVKMYFLIL